MRNVGNMRLETIGDRVIEMSRDFNAPKQLVWDAYTKPELIKRWMGVHSGMTMPVCEVDLRVGGKYRYEWERPGMRMGLSGSFTEVATPDRLVATERFDESWYPGEAIDVATFVETNGKTTLTISVEYQSKEAREAVLKTPMEQGMAAGLDAMAEVLKTIS